MKIKYADLLSGQYIINIDHHISKTQLEQKINNKEVLLLFSETSTVVGYLRFNYFWDNTPFLNLLFIESQYRNQGYGKMLIEYWEHEMKLKGFNLVMTSTLANEGAQHFYRKLGYIDRGCLLLEGEALEIIFCKNL